MTLTLRPAETRGHENHGWLDARHSFSFADYRDPAHMGFRDLRVINEDRVHAGGGFPTHGHQNMEIVTYVVQGALAHKDSTGGEGMLKRGDVQAMTAGYGVRHSEFNPSQAEDLRLLQIWILPERDGLAPSYRQKHFPDSAKRNTLLPLVSHEGADGALAIHQDLRLFASLLEPGAVLSHTLASGRAAWVQMVEGEITVNGTALKTGDGASIEDVTQLDIAAKSRAEFLLFDLA